MSVLGDAWEDIRNAVQFLLDNPRHKSLEGNCWKAYRVDKDIRVDIFPARITTD